MTKKISLLLISTFLSSSVFAEAVSSADKNKDLHRGGQAKAKSSAPLIVKKEAHPAAIKKDNHAVNTHHDDKHEIAPKSNAQNPYSPHTFNVTTALEAAYETNLSQFPGVIEEDNRYFYEDTEIYFYEDGDFDVEEEVTTTKEVTVKTITKTVKPRNRDFSLKPSLNVSHIYRPKQNSTYAFKSNITISEQKYKSAPRVNRRDIYMKTGVEFTPWSHIDLKIAPTVGFSYWKRFYNASGNTFSASNNVTWRPIKAFSLAFGTSYDSGDAYATVLDGLGQVKSQSKTESQGLQFDLTGTYTFSGGQSITLAGVHRESRNKLLTACSKRKTGRFGVNLPFTFGGALKRPINVYGEVQYTKTLFGGLKTINGTNQRQNSKGWTYIANVSYEFVPTYTLYAGYTNSISHSNDRASNNKYMKYVLGIKKSW